ncbi:hypothetical protein B296_00018207 [Ensete ventricosum]|uniref:Uncharacterized protein n=1 Tax=Ensete ventricosum TaxID=4639 RepID=A0A427AW82_ENSVE|nr:hypothetical protein B296_00018207 [Ensete ventricosum]
MTTWVPASTSTFPLGTDASSHSGLLVGAIPAVSRPYRRHGHWRPRLLVESRKQPPLKGPDHGWSPT